MERLRVLISKGEIEGKVAELATAIRRDYQAKNPLLVGVLKGSFIFMADLVRALNTPLEVEFVGLSSYGSAMESGGEVKLTQRLRIPIKGRDVLVVEDIVDTGYTVRFLLDYLYRRKPASLKLCALFDKPSRRVVDVSIDYLGFIIPDAFVVGYGLDFDEGFRYLPDLCILEGENEP
jgi:hypoxanthine phosphoribosyltransferase